MQGYAPTCREEAFTGAREQFPETEEWLAGEAADLSSADRRPVYGCRRQSVPAALQPDSPNYDPEAANATHIP
jgi:hypothetical protein